MIVVTAIHGNDTPSQKEMATAKQTHINRFMRHSCNTKEVESIALFIPVDRSLYATPLFGKLKTISATVNLSGLLKFVVPAIVAESLGD